MSDALHMEEGTRVGEPPFLVQQGATLRPRKVELREYKETAPAPTTATGNIIIDSLNALIDTLVFGSEEVERHRRDAATSCYAAQPQQQPREPHRQECDGSTDYRAFLSGMCVCHGGEPTLPPLPTPPAAGRFADLDPFSCEVLGQLSKEEPEFYLPYMHFHRITLAHQADFSAEGLKRFPQGEPLPQPGSK
ncbi:uncharacterized protein LOC34618520 [Cyclospora cayetanensis]|uniref:Uncharacterized protein LOC34618520 n=1 Tax=Cyclospora cayetanensis TaxID=88456 RepID=A0A6P6RXT5_9EIME|nr:uncharacterized protein LOC34618520 [Cyclospora cayetanensis]